MRVVKNINNNVALCLDSKGNEVIAFGKGIGWAKAPYDIDIKVIEKTFYNMDAAVIDIFNEIEPEIIELASTVVDYARTKLDIPFNNSIVLTLADHINFAIKRLNSGMNIKYPLYYDIKQMYEQEMDIGQYALKLIVKSLKIYLPKEEASNIAIHFINAEKALKSSDQVIDEEQYIEHITKVIEEFLNVSLNKDSFNYSRFATHMQYLFKRRNNGKEITSENDKLYKSLVETFPRTYECALCVNDYLSIKLEWDLSNEELLYLMLHINRLCAREDCDR
ncbi:MAG: PRD domain-containing protein [Anaerorhabdus sp.]